MKAGVQIRGKKFDAILDTGAAASLISESVFNSLNEDKSLSLQQWDGGHLTGAQGSRLKDLGMIEMEVDLGGVVETIRLVVVADLAHDVLLGNDSLDKFGAVINVPARVVKVRGQRVKIRIETETTAPACLVFASDVDLQPREIRSIQCRLKGPYSPSEGIVEQSDKADLPEHIYVTRSLVSVGTDRTVSVLMANFSESSRHFRRGRPIGTISELAHERHITTVSASFPEFATPAPIASVDTVPPKLPTEGEEFEVELEKLMKKVDPELTELQRKQLQELSLIHI